jgi:hypothetical protein
MCGFNTTVLYYITVRQWLSENYLDWIGHGCNAPVSWSSRSPDLNHFHGVELNNLQVKEHTRNL